jgi:hypothetical protein
VSAHTPGRWYVGCTLSDGTRCVVGDGDSVVCTFPDRSGPTYREDARLIAAAPELLAALEGVASESTPGERAETIDGAANLTARDWIARAVDTLRAADTDDCPLPDTVGDVLDDLTRALRRIDAARAAIAKAKGEE